MVLRSDRHDQGKERFWGRTTVFRVTGEPAGVKDYCKRLIGTCACHRAAAVFWPPVRTLRAPGRRISEPWWKP
jgi:hypothetical protein